MNIVYTMYVHDMFMYVKVYQVYTKYIHSESSIRTIIFSKIAIIFSIHTFSIFARIFSIPGVPERSGLFPALLQYRSAWSAHMNLKIKRSVSQQRVDWHFALQWSDCYYRLIWSSPALLCVWQWRLSLSHCWCSGFENQRRSRRPTASDRRCARC